MGVTQLWSILEPIKCQGDVASLKGKTLCVDLSGWICEAQGSKGLKANVLKPHLRNLFFRVWNLTRAGVKLVFVVDGDAPEVKWESIVKRNEARNGYGGGGRGRGRGRFRGGAGGQRKKDGRSNFRIWVKECTTLLRLLGVPYVESAGEAEALCAWMDAQGIVDGCITNDGDAFLYGARNVYKDLCISNKECTMDFYCMDDIENKLCLNREKLVSLAILLGCDYLPQGVPGVGKEMGLKLVQALPGVNLLQRLQDWKGSKGCEDDLSKIEKTVKLKALKVAGFPSQAVIKEFTCPELKTQHLTVPKVYKCPDLKGLQDFCLNYLEWPEDYTADKILPLVTYWQMEAGVSVKHCNGESIVTPERIVKARVQNRIECYEILWRNNDIGHACQSTFVTIETRSLFGQVYPTLVEEFEILQNEKKKKKTGKRKAKHNAEDLPNDNSNALEELCSELEILSLAAERESHRETTSQTKLSDGKQAASSEDEIAEAEWENKNSGSSLDDENIVDGSQMKQEEELLHEEDVEQQHTIHVKYLQRKILAPNKTKERKAPKGKTSLKSEEKVVNGLKKKQKRQELQQRCEDDEQRHSDGAKYVETGNLVPGDENGKKDLEKKQILEVEEPLDSVTSSSEDELSDSFLCEFVVPLARRLERQCRNNNKNERTVLHNTRGDTEIDFPGLVHSADSKSKKKSNAKDNEIHVVLIDSSEDESEQDDICHGLRSKENSRQKPHILEKSAFGIIERPSSRKYDGTTTRYLESDVKMTSTCREEMCARTEHKPHAVKKTEDDGTLNGKDTRKEAVSIPLVNEARSYRGQIATENTKKNDEENSETKTKPGNHCHERCPSSLPRQSGLSVKGFDLSAFSSSRDRKIRSDRKPKVMQRVYFSSDDDDDDDDDSWFIGSGNGATAAASGDKDRGDDANDYWFIGTTNDDGGATAAATSGAGDLGGASGARTAYSDKGHVGDADGYSWHTGNGDDSVVAVASTGGNNHSNTKIKDFYSGRGDADDKEKTKSKKSTKPSKKKVSKMSSSKTMETKPLCLDLNLSAITNVQTRQKATKTEGKMLTNKLMDEIHLGKLTPPKYMEANGWKIQCAPPSKVQGTPSQLKMKQTDSLNNVGKVSKFHLSTHKQDDVFSMIDKSEKVFTPRLLEKTEEKENVESPLDDVFVPLSLSERLGRNLSGRRNVLNTLRTLSSN